MRGGEGEEEGVRGGGQGTSRAADPAGCVEQAQGLGPRSSVQPPARAPPSW